MAKAYLHIRAGRWQWRCDDVTAVVELRDAATHRTLCELPAELATLALLHYVGQAQLTAAVLPQLPPTRPPGRHDWGQPRLRGAEKRRLRGRKGPQAET